MKQYCITDGWASSALFFKRKDLYFSELYGMALGLKGNVTFRQHLILALDKLHGIQVFFIKLRPLVFQHDLAVNDVLDDIVAMNFNFHLDPLVAVIRF